ncbi:spinster family MFS transporter [Elongatibacter sediminis]|uniref:MFS transporter n=1 Tax=Elongatibacter sediminis TaxID=3119006 RepID=A0AAW9RCU1_9GAMM
MSDSDSAATAPPAPPSGPAGNPTREAPWPKPVYAWYVVGVLMLAYTNSFIDRQILSLLIEPIRRDLQITDTQISLLAGIAFTIFYTVMGVPIARLADQRNRRRIITFGLAFWSVMTATCGLARNFWHMFAARVGVGVGEATLSPAAMSIISDYFPVGKLARAISIYSMGVYFGAGLALIIGGLVVQLVSQAGSVTLPVVGEIFPWQMTFFVVGLMGLPVLLLLMTVREPVRRGVAASGSAEAAAASSLPALKAFIRRNARTVVFHFAAFSCIGVGIAGFLVWTPTLFIRTWGFEASQIGFIYGFILFIGGTSGVYAGGYVADWLQNRGHDDAILRAAFYCSVAVVPFAVLTPLAPNPSLAIAGLAVTAFLLAFPQGLPAAALQVITPNALRAQMTAVYFLVGNLIANGFGPTLYALVTDYVFKDPAMLRYSMAWGSGIVLPLGALFAWLALKPYRASVIAARKTAAEYASG